MKITSVHILLAAALCGAVSAQAAELDRWYISADAGRSDFSLKDGDLNQLAPTPNTSVVFSNRDKQDTAYSLHGGYRLNSNFAFEAGYSDFGSATFTGARSIICNPTQACVAIAFAPYNGKLQASSWDASMVGRYDLGSNWSAYGKLGVSAVRMKTTISFLSPSSTTNSRNSTVPTLGAGVAYQFTPTVSMEAGWNRHYAGSEDANNGKSNIDAYTLGLTYHF